MNEFRYAMAGATFGLLAGALLAGGAQAQAPMAPAPSTQAPAAQAPATPPAAAPSLPAVPPSGAAQPSGSMQPSGSAHLSAADRHFVEQAAIGGTAEVDAAQLAQQKSSSDDVKKFAQEMIDDHGKANSQLSQLAQQKGIDLPTSNAKSEAEAKQLGKLSGPAFDRKYAALQVKDHEAAVKLFRTEAKSGSDGDLKSFASDTVPTLEQHLDNAKAMAQSTRGAAEGSSAASGGRGG